MINSVARAAAEHSIHLEVYGGVGVNVVEGIGR